MKPSGSTIRRALLIATVLAGIATGPATSAANA
jgi:hypothetical protein